MELPIQLFSAIDLFFGRWFVLCVRNSQSNYEVCLNGSSDNSTVYLFEMQTKMNQTVNSFLSYKIYVAHSLDSTAQWYIY